MNPHALLLAALLAAAPAIFAQTDKKQPEPAGQQMPAPRHKQHDALKALAGTWECVMRMEAMPGVPGMEEATESTGTEQAELICNGLWLKAVLHSTWKEQPFQGIWLAGYDPFQKKYIGIWVSSDEQEGSPCTMDGSYDEATKAWTWQGKTPHGEMRSVQTFKDADHAVETCYIKGPDGKETKCMESTRKRIRPAVVAEASARGEKKLSKEMDLLHKEVGDWAATVKSIETPGQEPEVMEATERVTSTCNGRWLWTHFKGEFQGTPFTGHALYGFDSVQKQFVCFWMDSMSPTYAKTAGTYDAAKKVLNLDGTCLDPVGKTMTMKQAFTWKDANTRILEMEFKGAERASTMEIVYRRKTKE